MRKENRSWYSRTYLAAASAASAPYRRMTSAGASKPATLFVRVHAPNESRVVTRHATHVGSALENRAENADGRNSSAKSGAASLARFPSLAKENDAGALAAAYATRNAHTSSCLVAGLRRRGANPKRPPPFWVPAKNASAKSAGPSRAGEYGRVADAGAAPASAGSAKPKTTKMSSAQTRSRRSVLRSRASSHCVSTSASAKVSRPTFCVFQGVCWSSGRATVWPKIRARSARSAHADAIPVGASPPRCSASNIRARSSMDRGPSAVRGAPPRRSCARWRRSEKARPRNAAVSLPKKESPECRLEAPREHCSRSPEASTLSLRFSRFSASTASSSHPRQCMSALTVTCCGNGLQTAVAAPSS